MCKKRAQNQEGQIAVDPAKLYDGPGKCSAYTRAYCTQRQLWEHTEVILISMVDPRITAIPARPPVNWIHLKWTFCVITLNFQNFDHMSSVRR